MRWVVNFRTLAGKSLAVGLLVVAGMGGAWAINKCERNGQTVYQDTPCEADRNFVARSKAKEFHLEQLYKKLDQLAEHGVGVPLRDTVSDDDGYTSRRSARQDNARSAALLSRSLYGMRNECGRSMQETPKVGMSDEVFRNCTTHARYGGIYQIVNSSDEGTPLRLYLFRNSPQRIYMVGGEITAIKP
ncbi:MAG: hypothetical protein LWW81_15960 [Rhodocyclales bacterium]|nr:hypothetical protein [Rhodocyclales bacterium]